MRKYKNIFFVVESFFLIENEMVITFNGEKPEETFEKRENLDDSQKILEKDANPRLGEI